jgi:lipopolysaccharide export LptBFGC system permease protein LptF
VIFGTSLRDALSTPKSLISWFCTGRRTISEGRSLTSQPVDQASLKLTLMYSGVHGVVFVVLGVIAAYLLLLPKRKLHFGIALLALFVVLELGFVGTAFVLAKPVLDKLTWPIVFIGNFLAAAGMACYLSLRRGNYPSPNYTTGND